MTMQAFCDETGAEVSTWDPLRKTPAISRGQGVEFADANRKFNAERVAAEGEGTINHYNALDKDERGEQKEQPSQYEEMREE
eukprot:3167740-Rhodomonas_salina.1